jgi:hypothetical protein
MLGKEVGNCLYLLMSVSQEAEEHHVERPKKSIVWIVWNIMFALFYPVLAAFSVIIMVLMFIASTLSNFVSWFINLFKRS